MNASSASAAILLSVTLALSGCGVAGDTATPGTGSTPVTSAPPLPTTTSVAPAPGVSTTTAPAPPLSSASRLRIDGLGPIEVGMTVAQARAVAGVELSLAHEPYCDVLRSPRGPKGVSLIVPKPATGRIELISVDEGSVATLSGIRVGSSEAEVVATYPGRLRSVNPSSPIHRLIYEAADPALADRALVFIMADSRVMAMYAGVRGYVEADEICG